MNWNPFKRIAALEQELNGLKLSHNRLIDRVDAQERDLRTLTAQVADLDRNFYRWVADLDTRSQDLQTRIDTVGGTFNAAVDKFNKLNISHNEHYNWMASIQKQLISRGDINQSDTPITLTRADVEKETKARLKRAAYSRKYYANKRAEAAKAAAGGAK